MSASHLLFRQAPYGRDGVFSRRTRRKYRVESPVLHAFTVCRRENSSHEKYNPILYTLPFRLVQQRHAKTEVGPPERAHPHDVRVLLKRTLHDLPRGGITDIDHLHPLTPIFAQGLTVKSYKLL